MSNSSMISKSTNSMRAREIIASEVQKLSKNKDIVSVAIGGSLPRGYWTPGADIDLIIISKSGDPLVDNYFEPLRKRLAKEVGSKLDTFVYPLSSVEWASKHNELPLFQKAKEAIAAKYRRNNKMTKNVDNIRQKIHKISALNVRKKLYNLSRRSYHPFIIQLWDPVYDQQDFIKKCKQIQQNKFEIPAIFQPNGIKNMINKCKNKEMSAKELWLQCKKYDFWEVVKYVNRKFESKD